MTINWLALFALIPIGLTLVLRYGYARPMKQTMLLVCGVTVLLSFFIWKVSWQQIAASIAQGFVVSAEMIILMLAALFLTHVLRHSRVFAWMREGFARVGGNDRRVQAILVAWLFGSGIEGLFGFASACSTCAAILGGLGFPPACAVIVSVIGPVAANSFCSVGLPINYGVLNSIEPALLKEGVGDFLQKTTFYTAIIQGLIGTFLPIFITATMVPFFGKKYSRRDSLSILPFALFAGLAFTIPYATTAIFLGPEFSALVGSVIGSAIVITATRTGFLLPREHWNFPPQSEWEHDWTPGKNKYGYVYQPEAPVPMPIWKAWMPYGLLVLLLILGRQPFAEPFLRSLSLQWPNLFDSPITVTFQPFYMPTMTLLLVTGVSIFLYRTSYEMLQEIWGHWLLKIGWFAVMTLPLTVATTFLYIHSGNNSSGLPSMPCVIAEWLAGMPGSNIWLLILTPLLGAAGTFFAHNNTFSSMMFSDFQACLGQNLGIPSSLAVALLIVGGSAGTMISLHYLTGGAVVGMLGSSGSLGRKTARPMFIYLIVIGILGVIISQFFV